MPAPMAQVKASYKRGRLTRPASTRILARVARAPSASQADGKLTILHSSDAHARFEPISTYDSGCSVKDTAAGGSARLGRIGLIPVTTDAPLSPGDNIIVTDPLGAILAEAGRLAAEDIPKIIVLSHSGSHVD